MSVCVVLFVIGIPIIILSYCGSLHGATIDTHTHLIEQIKFSFITEQH